MSSRRFACLATLSLLLAAPNARADGPAPSAPSPEAPPAAAPAPAPPPRYWSYAPPPVWYPPPLVVPTAYTPMRRRSPRMIAAGVVLSSVSTVAVAAGAAMLARVGSAPEFDCSFCPGASDLGGAYKPAGIVTLVVGVLAGGAGLPLLIVGAQKVPDTEPPSLVPTVGLGPGRASASWRF